MLDLREICAVAPEQAILLHFDVHTLIAGRTGRDPLAMRPHIQELEAIGVKPPRQTPMFYRAAADRLTAGDSIEVAGSGSTGEVECVLFHAEQGMLIGLDSDHTDHELEAHSVTLSKQACPKPVASGVWRWCDLAPHSDQLLLRCVATTARGSVLYQQGSATSMRPAQALITYYVLASGKRFAPGSVMFGGTLPA